MVLILMILTFMQLMLGHDDDNGFIQEFNINDYDDVCKLGSWQRFSFSQQCCELCFKQSFLSNKSYGIKIDQRSNRKYH